MKNIIPMTAILLTSLALTACAPFRVGNVRIGNTPARKIAKSTDIPGKGVDGQCLPFANALHARFKAAGIPSKVLAFRYEALLSTPMGVNSEPDYRVPKPFGGAHAAVAYNDDGRTYLMDNLSWNPKWVSGDSDKGLAQQFAGMDFNVLEARVLNGSAPRRSRPATKPAAPMVPSVPAVPEPSAPEMTLPPSYFTAR